MFDFRWSMVYMYSKGGALFCAETLLRGGHFFAGTLLRGTFLRGTFLRRDTSLQ